LYITCLYKDLGLGQALVGDCCGKERSWSPIAWFYVTDRHARQPKPEMTGIKKLHHLFIDELESRLRARGVCLRLEYTGSSYEGAKVRRSDADSDLEFDIMFILRGGTDLRVFIQCI